jgi:lysozyme family protein
MSADFRRAVAFVLKEEGGYTNDPVDRGGATNKIDSTTDMVSH